MTRRTAAAAAASKPTGPMYSVLLPTYNERENLPICIWLIVRAFEQWYCPVPKLRRLDRDLLIHVLACSHGVLGNP